MSNDISNKNEINSSKETVQSLVKGLAVIQAFNEQRTAMSLSEVAAITGFTRAATRRFLLTLVHEGYAKQIGKQFSLTAKILDLGFSYLSTLDVWHNAKPLMKGLVELLNESCSAAVLESFDVIYVARVATTKRIMSINLNIGTRLPAFATSLGRVLLANLSEDKLNDFLNNCPIEKFTEFTLIDKNKLITEIKAVKKQGWSIVEQELEVGLMSISVPVLNVLGDTIAALSISTHTSQTARKELVELILPELKKCALAISQG